MLGQVKNPIIFLGISGVIIAYLLYMMIRRRKGLRPGEQNREPEL
jgi:hypothetical protein